jgi:hypothetical protein
MTTKSDANYEFYHNVVCAIPGWLNQGAAIRTMDMLEFQEEQGMRGALLEIGVHAGRYFSILVRSAARTKSRVVGVDRFLDPSVEKVQQTVTPLLGGGAAIAILIPAHSTELDAPGLLDHLSERARFISVDGSHECHDVFWDLRLSEQLLAPGGVVAVDDFINPIAFGVNEAVHRFFLQPRRLVPWAYIENKLFLCHAHWAQRYTAMLEHIIMDDATERHSDVFRRHIGISRQLVERTLWGSSLLILGP